MSVVIAYVEDVVGEVVSWLHTKDAYFEIMMDSVYGQHMGAEDDDTYRGYGTYNNDDGSVGGFDGPKPKTHDANPKGNGRVNSGRKFADSAAAAEQRKLSVDAFDEAGGAPSSPFAAGSGVTKLVTDIYALSPSSTEEKHAELTAQYYAAIAQAVQTAGGGPGNNRFRNMMDGEDGEEDLEETSAGVGAGANKAITEMKLHPALTAVITTLAFAAGIVATNFVDKRSSASMSVM